MKLLSDEISHLWTWFRGPTSLHLSHIVLTDRQFPQDKYSIKLVDMATAVWIWDQICLNGKKNNFPLRRIHAPPLLSQNDSHAFSRCLSRTFLPTSIKHEPLMTAEIFGETQPCWVRKVRIVGLRRSNISTSRVADAVQLEGNVRQILARFNETLGN